MGLLKSTSKARAKGNDIKRKLLMNGERLFMLKRAGETGLRFTLVRELVKGWMVEWSDYRGQMRVVYPTVDPTFSDDMAVTSFVGYGVPAEKSPGVFQVDVYGINQDRKDVIPPTVNSPEWKFFMERVSGARYTLE